MQTLEAVDDHTLRCKTAGVTYVPIPPGGTVDLAGLMTLDLPSDVRKGQRFRIVIRQVMDRPAPQRTRRGTVDFAETTRLAFFREAVQSPAAINTRHILGAFQFSVLVKTANDILPADRRHFTALQHMFATIPPENRWHLVVHDI